LAGENQIYRAETAGGGIYFGNQNKNLSRRRTAENNED
jgi:hypothetical protein